MRVPEAVVALDTIRRISPGTDVWLEQVRRILDDVWLTAYEEGRDRVFEPPPVEMPYKSKHKITKPSVQVDAYPPTYGGPQGVSTPISREEWGT